VLPVEPVICTASISEIAGGKQDWNQFPAVALGLPAIAGVAGNAAVVPVKVEVSAWPSNALMEFPLGAFTLIPEKTPASPAASLANVLTSTLPPPAPPRKEKPPSKSGSATNAVEASAIAFCGSAKLPKGALTLGAGAVVCAAGV
jgi:hypothetical protein